LMSGHSCDIGSSSSNGCPSGVLSMSVILPSARDTHLVPYGRGGGRMPVADVDGIAIAYEILREGQP